MKLRTRTLAWILSIVMILAIMPVIPVFAADGDHFDTDAEAGDSYCCRVGEEGTDTGSKYYTSVSSALTAVKNTTATIYLLKDAPCECLWDKLGADSNWTIELNNHTLNFTGDWFGDSDLTAVTFRNGTVNCVRLLRCRTPVTLTFDHVVLTSTAMFLNLRGNSTINIIASTITSNGQDCIYVAPLGSTITFNLTEGSSWIRNGGVNSYTSALISTDGATGAGANTLNMNVDGTSTIKLAHTDLATDHYFVNSDGDKSEISLNVTLASGANVVFAAESAGNNLISNMPNTTITDNGANWKVLGKTLKNGVTLPDFATLENYVTRWTVNGKTFYGGTKYTDAEAVDGTEYTATYAVVEAPITSYEDAVARGYYVHNATTDT